MSISLNNHESRIKTLENKGSGYLFPDYSKAVKLANAATNYKAPSNGFISFDIFENRSSIAYITVNNLRLYQCCDSNDADGSINTFLPVTTSDSITWSYKGLFQNNGLGVWFIPAKIILNYLRFIIEEVLGL